MWQSNLRHFVKTNYISFEPVMLNVERIFRIAYDFFHLVKLGNDSMLIRLRKRRQRKLQESGDEQSYRPYKECRLRTT
jgi:hypothetical protein